MVYSSPHMEYIMGIITILWEKWREFVRDFSRITMAALIAPLMYLIVFGWGIRTTMNGMPYLNFLIPGVVALTTMNGSFNAIAQNLNVQRLYEKAFDQVIISPTPLWQFIAGQILAGAFRGLYAGAIILLLVWPIETGLVFNGISILILFLNGAVFSALGIVVSFLARNHADVPRFSNYFIMPMAYLCNTFFSTDRIPHGPRELIAALPLSQTSRMVRGIAAKEPVNLLGILVLLAYLIVLTGIGLYFVYKKKNL
jgi:ABC-2 type transport system permease protein